MCVLPEGVPVEDIILAVGNIIGDENIRAASCMNQKVVVFVSDDELVHDVVSAGISTESGHFMMASLIKLPLREL